MSRWGTATCRPRSIALNVLSFGSKSGDFTTYNLPAVENYTLLSAASNATSLNLAGTAYTYVVTKTADDGSTGTLRDAINQVNNQSVAPLGVIVFDIPGTGVQTIQVQLRCRPLPRRQSSTATPSRERAQIRWQPATMRCC